MTHNTLSELFSAIANAIRAKTGKSETIVADDFPTEINNISVGVEGGIIPTGTKSIIANGTYDVTSYASASVNVPVGIIPSRIKTITENGTHDVTDYASAVVSVPNPTVVRTFTLDADLGAAAPYQYDQNVISGDSFIKQYYNNSTLSITMVPVTPFAADANVMQFIRQSNSPMHKIDSTDYYGIASLSQGASNVTLLALSTTVPLTSKTSVGGGFKIDSSGNINICGGNSNTTKPRIVKAGSYMLIMTVRG